MSDAAAGPAEAPAAAAGAAAGGAAGSAKTPRPAVAAKIKRIMQADEEVGKINQYTPLVLGRAMELFLASLAGKAAEVAKKRKAKLLTGSHLKAALEGSETLDFLKPTVARAADLPPEAEGGGGESEGEGKKRKPAAPRKPRAKPDGSAPKKAKAAAKPAAKPAAPPRKAGQVKGYVKVDDSDEEGAPAGGAAPAAEAAVAAAEAPPPQAWAAAAVAPGPAVEEEDFDA